MKFDFLISEKKQLFFYLSRVDLEDSYHVIPECFRYEPNFTSFVVEFFEVAFDISVVGCTDDRHSVLPTPSDNDLRLFAHPESAIFMNKDNKILSCKMNPPPTIYT